MEAMLVDFIFRKKTRPKSQLRIEILQRVLLFYLAPLLIFLAIVRLQWNIIIVM